MGWIRKIAVSGLLLCLLGSGFSGHAQTFGEFFRQKKTQKKYLLQQVAALEVYAGYLKKGYELVDGGLTMVKDITSGEFGLHEAFFSSLKMLSPAIRDDVRIAEIVVMQVSILKAFGHLKSRDMLSADQLAYLGLVGEAVMSECFTDLEELLLVITAGKLEMKDEERLSRLDQVYQRMLDKSAFTQHFLSNVNFLIRQQSAQLKSINGLGRWFWKEGRP